MLTILQTEKFIAYFIIAVHDKFRFNHTLEIFKLVIYLENILKALKHSLQVVVSTVDTSTHFH